MKLELRHMIGHGAIILFLGMLAGVGLLVSLVGGLEILPGTILEFSIPGDADGWVRTHIGSMLNGILIIIVALLIHHLGINDTVASKLRWMLVGTGYANTLFYLAALLAPNRALTFGDNRLGESNIAAIIGLAPALVFAVISLIAIFIVIQQAFRPTHTQ